jgi:hypothetical protein
LVARLLRAARKDRFDHSYELEPCVELAHLARRGGRSGKRGVDFDFDFDGFMRPQIVDCSEIQRVGRDPVQAENCLAALQFFQRAEYKLAKEVDPDCELARVGPEWHSQLIFLLIR